MEDTGLEVEGIKKDGKSADLPSLKNQYYKGQTRLMAAAGRSAGVPQVKEIQSLNFHESPVNQEIITEHNDHREDEMGNGLRGYKWSSFILNFRHEISISPL